MKVEAQQDRQSDGNNDLSSPLASQSLLSPPLQPSRYHNHKNYYHHSRHHRSHHSNSSDENINNNTGKHHRSYHKYSQHQQEQEQGKQNGEQLKQLDGQLDSPQSPQEDEQVLTLRPLHGGNEVNEGFTNNSCAEKINSSGTAGIESDECFQRLIITPTLPTDNGKAECSGSKHERRKALVTTGGKGKSGHSNEKEEGKRRRRGDDGNGNNNSGEDDEEDVCYKFMGIPLRLPLPVFFPLLSFLAIFAISLSAFWSCWSARESVLTDIVVTGRKEILGHTRLFRAAFLSRVVSEFTRILGNTVVATSVLWQYAPLEAIAGENFSIAANLDLCESMFRPVTLSYAHFTTVGLLVQHRGRENMFYVHVHPNASACSYTVGVLDTGVSSNLIMFGNTFQRYNDTEMYSSSNNNSSSSSSSNMVNGDGGASGCTGDWNLSLERGQPGRSVNFDMIPLWTAVKNSPKETKSMWTITNSFILSDVDGTVVAYSKKLSIPKRKRKAAGNASAQSLGLSCSDEEKCCADSGASADDDDEEETVGFVSTIFTHKQMQKLFGSLPITKNGATFVTDGSPELRVIGSQNIDAFYGKEQISSFAHPSPVVREIARVFTQDVLPGLSITNLNNNNTERHNCTNASTTNSTKDCGGDGDGELNEGEFKIFNSTSFVDFEMIPLGEPGHHWWLFAVTPQKDLFEETLVQLAEAKRSIKSATLRMAAYALFIITLCVVLSLHLSTGISRIAQEIESCARLRTDTPALRVNTLFREVAEISDRASRLKRTLESYVRYVPMPVIEMGVMGSPRLKLEQREAVIMFLDVANFTCLSELFGSEMLGVLNRMFDEFSKILIEHGAVIDKYIGDAIMAFWNVPFPVPSSGEAAVRSAVTIINKLEALNATVFEPRLKTRMRVRIGISCGPVYAGNVGVPQRINYTVLGKNVNVAAHLEPFNKELGTRVLVTAAVREACAHCSDICFRRLGQTLLKGMSEETIVDQLLGDRTYTSSRYTAGMIARYEPIDRMLCAYLSGDDLSKSRLVEKLKNEYQSYMTEYENDTAVRYFYEKMFK